MARNGRASLTHQRADGGGIITVVSSSHRSIDCKRNATTRGTARQNNRTHPASREHAVPSCTRFAAKVLRRTAAIAPVGRRRRSRQEGTRLRTKDAAVSRDTMFNPGALFYRGDWDVCRCKWWREGGKAAFDLPVALNMGCNLRSRNRRDITSPHTDAFIDALLHYESGTVSPRCR